MSMHAAFAAALLAPSAPVPEGLVTWNGSDPAARYAVYRNNVIVSLCQALADSYPVCRALVGDAFFRAMAGHFVRLAPPCSPVLVRYGGRFPAFLEQFEPVAALPYLADVARLEWLRVQAYHAPQDDALEGAAIAAAMADPSLLPRLIFHFKRDVCLLRSGYAIVSLWRAHHGAIALSDLRTDLAECALIVRDGDEVKVLELDEPAAVLASRLMDGLALGKAIDATAERFRGLDLAPVLAQLFIHKTITAITLTNEDGKS